MNATRSNLQRQVFQDLDERLSAFVSIVKVDGRKKKKPSLLCVTLSSEHPISVRLYVIKADRENSYRVKEKFQLRDIKYVDGINPRKPTSDFHLTIADSPSRLFVASTSEEKDTFIRQLYKLSRKYCPAQMPEFANVPIPVDEPTVIVPIETINDDANDGVSGYQPIAAKEEADFRRLLARSELRIDQADLFAKVLSDQLQSLDGANIESMMGSEAAVNHLLLLLDNALDKCNELESEVDQCDKILAAVRDSVDLIEEKDSLSVVERRNKERLTVETRDFLQNLDVLSEKHLAVLKEANISDPTSISRVVEAAHAVSRFVHAAIPKSLLQMRAYSEQANKLTVLDLFVDRLMSHLSALFNNLSEVAVDSSDWHSLSIPKQSQRHRALAPLADLMGWLKGTRPVVYNAAIDRYVAATRILYQRLFDRFFDAICNEVARITGGSTNDRKFNSSFNDSHGSTDVTLPALIETVMGELNAVIVNEQKFCVRFFHMNSELLMAADTVSNESGESGSLAARNKDMNNQVRNMMEALFFHSLNLNLDRFTKACCRNNSILQEEQNNLDKCQLQDKVQFEQTNFDGPSWNILLLFVLLSKKVLQQPSETTDAGSYYATTFGSLMINIKRQFDIFMEGESHSLADVRVTKRTRIGILPTIERFAAIIKRSEAMFEGAERRADLEKWYQSLERSICDGIERAAISPNSKSPASVVRFENYHQLYMTLSELKISSLNNQRKDVKTKKEESIEAYVHEHMGRPLEKIQLFFDNVGRAIESGIRPEEISYQQPFSKAELKKVVAQYPGKEVRKGLEQLYKKLEKHLIDNSSLLQVVWRSMQEKFINQIQEYQQRIAACYPGSKLELEFSVQDVLSYFSDIAQSH